MNIDALNGEHSSPSASDTLTFRNVRVVYSDEHGTGPVHALEDVSLSVAAGEFVSVIGPSGCGKSTLLRVAADLEKPTAGQVWVGGEPPKAARLQRKVGFVFQDAALLEWRRILQNIALPLELKGVRRSEREKVAVDLINLVGLTGFERSYPRQLSGGMRQRAAIARAMCTEPQVMLMDEPFGALDQITRDRLNMELLALSEQNRITVVFVTHSIQEAVLLSDRVFVMTPRPGHICGELDINLPRPRSLKVRQTKEFLELVKQGATLLQQAYL